jgi:hypothetical protein
MEDNIWQTTLKVWEQLPDMKIAPGFVQTHQITAEIIKGNGGNASLGFSRWYPERLS